MNQKITEAEYVERRGNIIVDSGRKVMRRVAVGVPLTGTVRVEWMFARYGQVIPVNWSNGEFTPFIDTFSPLAYAVDDARNMCVDYVVREGFEWLIFIDHDVVVPHDLFIKFGNYMAEGKYPVVSGLYRTKSCPAEPLVFRGRGNSWFRDWKLGDKVMVDGIPMGCALISGKLLKAMYDESETYKKGEMALKKVFYTPRDLITDPETGAYSFTGGTEDLWWCDRVMNEGWLKRLGFDHVSNEPYPFLLDTSIDCKHINTDGAMY
jgi:hypothetical protein